MSLYQSPRAREWHGAPQRIGAFQMAQRALVFPLPYTPACGKEGGATVHVSSVARFQTPFPCCASCRCGTRARPYDGHRPAGVGEVSPLVARARSRQPSRRAPLTHGAAARPTASVLSAGSTRLVGPLSFGRSFGAFGSRGRRWTCKTASTASGASLGETGTTSRDPAASPGLGSSRASLSRTLIGSPLTTRCLDFRAIRRAGAMRSCGV